MIRYLSEIALLACSGSLAAWAMHKLDVEPSLAAGLFLFVVSVGLAVWANWRGE
jgi:hypothetical protein